MGSLTSPYVCYIYLHRISIFFFTIFISKGIKRKQYKNMYVWKVGYILQCHLELCIG